MQRHEKGNVSVNKFLVFGMKHVHALVHVQDFLADTLHIQPSHCWEVRIPFARKTNKRQLSIKN